MKNMKKFVLFLEDDVRMEYAESYKKKFMVKFGLEFLLARNINQAESLLKKHDVRFIISDIKGFEGHGLSDLLKNCIKNKIKIIMYSGAGWFVPPELKNIPLILKDDESYLKILDTIDEMIKYDKKQLLLDSQVNKLLDPDWHTDSFEIKEYKKLLDKLKDKSIHKGQNIYIFKSKLRLLRIESLIKKSKGGDKRYLNNLMSEYIKTKKEIIKYTAGHNEYLKKQAEFKKNPKKFIAKHYKK